MFTVVFQQIIHVIKLFITKTTDFWSLWIIFWNTIVNFNDFYLLNQWKILLGGLGQSSRTVIQNNELALSSMRNSYHSTKAEIEKEKFQYLKTVKLKISCQRKSQLVVLRQVVNNHCCGLAVIFCGFISHLIGHETINIPEIFSGVHGFMGETVKMLG